MCILEQSAVCDGFDVNCLLANGESVVFHFLARPKDVQKAADEQEAAFLARPAPAVPSDPKDEQIASLTAAVEEANTKSASSIQDTKDVLSYVDVLVKAIVYLGGKVPEPEKPLPDPTART